VTTVDPVARRGAPRREDDTPASGARTPRAIAAAVDVLAVVIAGLVAGMTDVHPTIDPVGDVLARVGFAVALTGAVAWARRWTWIVLATAVLLGARTPLALACGAAVGALVIVAGRRREDERVVGAVAGAVGSIGLLHLGPVDPFGASALLGVLGATPALVSGLRRVDGRARRPVRVAALVAAVAVVLVGVGFVVGALAGAGDAQRGLDEARTGVDIARRGDGDAAATHLAVAREAFADAQANFDAWYAWPARWLPVVGQQADGLRRMAAVGRDLAASAHDTARQANDRGVSMGGGRVDVARLARLGDPLREARAAVASARARAGEIPTEWLAPPIRDRLDDLVAEVDGAGPELDTTIRAVDTVPDLLGASGRRSYLVLLTTPAESRGAGGYVASWAVLTADGGTISVTGAGRDVDLAPARGTAVLPIDAPPDFLARYASLGLDRAPGEVTSSPDFPSVAQAAASLYAHAPGGGRVDGVVLLDPYALGAMLRLTGPVQVLGLDGELTADNAADTFLRRQYELPTRVVLMADAIRQIFQAVLHAPDLRPVDVARELGPMVAQRRLALFSGVPDEQAFFADLGLTGAFPRHGDGGDLFGVVTQNAGDSRLDVYLHRAVTYRTELDPATGAVDVTATVRLRNDAPAGLPPLVTTNRPDTGQPPGTNWVWLNLYSPHALVSATGGDGPLDLTSERELGVNVYSGHVAVAPGAEVVVEVHLRGAVATGSPYRVRWFQQATVNADRVEVTLSVPDGWTAGVPGADRTATTVTDTRTDGDLTVPVGR